MFFFLSLAIVFLFILLLCYYLKNKINVLEKRVSSQTDVLGKLIRELKVQTCFGYGSENTRDIVLNGLKGGKLEPVLEDDSESDTSDFQDTDNEEEEEEVQDTGMEKVNDKTLLDIDETECEEDEYRGLDFEKVANEDQPVVVSEVKEPVISEEKAVYDECFQTEKEPKQQEYFEYETRAEPKNVLDENKAESKEHKFDDEESVYCAKIEDYHKMNLVQLKHVAQHTFHLSTTQISKMKKDDLLKWILAQ